MNQEVKARWIEALRSGKYEQGTQQLRSGDNFCCLGVLCDISEQGQWRKLGLGVGQCYMNGVTYLPTPVGRWAELDSHQERQLSNMNDNGLSFNCIAKHIEENY